MNTRVGQYKVRLLQLDRDPSRTELRRYIAAVRIGPHRVATIGDAQRDGLVLGREVDR